MQKRPSTQRKVYKNPPITEAVCEFQFADSDNWNVTSSGLLYEKLRTEYGQVPREQRLLRVIVPEGAKPGDVPNRLTEITKVEFAAADGLKKVTVGPGVCSAHVLKPYPGWEIFRPQIESALNHYSKVCAPKVIQRIGLRYINHIFFPVTRGTPDDFFTEHPRSVGHLDWPVSVFNLRHEYLIVDSDSEQVTAIVNLVTIPAGPEQFGCLLDIDLIHSWKHKTFSLKTSLIALDRLRTLERQAFEALITDITRALFDE